MASSRSSRRAIIACFWLPKRTDCLRWSNVSKRKQLLPQLHRKGRFWPHVNWRPLASSKKQKIEAGQRGLKRNAE